MAAESTIQDLGRFLEDENRPIPKEARDGLKRFASRLNFVSAFIKNSEGKGDQNEVVRETIRQLTNTVQEAEVVIKDFMLAVEKEKGTGPIFTMMIIGRVCDAVDRNTQKISNTIDDILDNFQLYGISMNVGVGFWFDSGKDHEGFDDFLPLTELNNPLKGYKANGTVIIAATINEMFLVTQVS
ncbi:hypothetical protein Ancab_028330 [Ancistrocladus abbreviatus]